MLKLTPLLLVALWGFAMFKFSAWQMRRQLDTNSTPLKDPALSELTKRMARALDLPRIDVNVFEIEPVNGLAAPDGRVFITRGFLKKYRAGEVTAPELASVIAHELGHVALNHSRRRMIDFAGHNAVRMVLMTVLGRFVPFIGPYIANFLVTLLAARLSRQDEYEADAYAAALLEKSGIGTLPQITLFYKLDEMTGTSGQPAWLMSHPRSGDRIAAIETLKSGWNR